MREIKIKLGLAGRPKEYDVKYVVENGEVTLKKISCEGRDVGFYNVNKSRLIYKKVCEAENIKHKEGA